MTPSPDLWTRGWRGPWLAALIALVAALPGLLALPVTDRAEARMAQASAQMLEDGNPLAVAVDDQAPDRHPLGVHWLQAAAVALTSGVESRQIWAYRLPAAGGAMVAAAACAWGAAALLGSGPGLLAGALLGGGMMASTVGAIDGPAALTCAGVTLAMAAFARLRLAQNGLTTSRWTRVLLWLGLSLSALAGGLAGPITVATAAVVLWAVERKAPWLSSLGWSWGLMLLAALAGPSLVAGLVAGGDAAPSWLRASSWSGGGRIPGFQLLVLPVLLFPFALLLPAAAVAARRAGADLAARLAACWLIPAWLVLEFSPGQPLAGGLLVYGAVAWLGAAAVRSGVGRRAALAGAALQAAAALLLIGLTLYAAWRFGAGAAVAWAVAVSILLAAAALMGGALLVRGQTRRAVALAGILGVAAHGAALAGMGPKLGALWVSQAAAEALRDRGLDPRAGVVPGPVAVAGFGEPSLTFALGGDSEALTADDAAEAVRSGRPAIVEAAEEGAFLAGLEQRGARGRRAAEVRGFDYANGRPVRLAIYGPAAPGF